MTAPARVSVVVPVHGRARLTQRCLQRVLADLPAGCEVVVVDDASGDETPAVLAGFGDAVRVLRLEQNRGFSLACNAGAEAAGGELLVFLNNDTEPQPGWLAALIEHADAHPETAVVGAKMLYPTGTVQHAGVVFGQDGYPHNLYAGFPADHPAADHPRRLQAVTGACMLVRRAAFERAGGFDDGYENSLEDVDFCLRLGHEGEEVHYCPRAIIVHLESATRGYEEKFERSVALYRERWRHRVRRDDLETYAADGLIEVEYPSSHPLRISVSPQLAGIERSDGHEAEVEPLLRSSGRRVTALQREVVRLRAELADRGAEVEESPDYEAFVAAFQGQVERSVPEGSSVLVLSRGDSELLRLGGRKAKHFPGDEDGRPLGHHPGDDAEAISMLEAARAAGAEYLVIPTSEGWWLRHYDGFAAHLSTCSRAEATDVCRIYALEPVRTGVSS